MSKKMKSADLNEMQQKLKDVMDGSTLMNQINGALTRRLVQRGGSLEDLTLMLSGVRGTAIQDAMLNACALTACYHLNTERVYGFADIKRECPIAKLQPSSSRGGDLDEALRALDEVNWYRHLDGRHMRLQCLIVSFRNMPQCLDDILDFGSCFKDQQQAPKGYHPGNTVEMFSFHKGAEKLLPVLAGNRIIALGDMNGKNRQPDYEVGSLSYPEVPRQYNRDPVMPWYTKLELSSKTQYKSDNSGDFFLFVANH